MSERNVMKFTKMHGIGNDYVYVDLFEETVSDPAKLAIAVSNRHFGIGADGLILIGPSDVADVSMRIFNADGSEAQMCGNGIRCVATYAYDKAIVVKDIIRVETRAGVKTVKVIVDGGVARRARVDMGPPKLLRWEIPMSGQPQAQCIEQPLTAAGRKWNVTCVSMGNPHCVIYTDKVDDLDLAAIGPAIERHAWFPERTNVHFVQVVNPAEVKMRTWERGSGITLACGTGASAVCVAGALTGRTWRKLLAHLPGGDLDLEWAEDDHVFMTGPTARVFTGEWPLT